jgi:hypothetical protein
MFVQKIHHTSEIVVPDQHLHLLSRKMIWFSKSEIAWAFIAYLVVLQ